MTERLALERLIWKDLDVDRKEAASLADQIWEAGYTGPRGVQDAVSLAIGEVVGLILAAPDGKIDMGKVRTIWEAALAPCPFCGGPARLSMHPRRYFLAHCADQACDPGYTCYAKPADWNRRG